MLRSLFVCFVLNIKCDIIILFTKLEIVYSISLSPRKESYQPPIGMALFCCNKKD